MIAHDYAHDLCRRCKHYRCYHAENGTGECCLYLDRDPKVAPHVCPCKHFMGPEDPRPRQLKERRELQARESREFWKDYRSRRRATDNA